MVTKIFYNTTLLLLMASALYQIYINHNINKLTKEARRDRQALKKRVGTPGAFKVYAGPEEPEIFLDIKFF